MASDVARFGLIALGISGPKRAADIDMFRCAHNTVSSDRSALFVVGSRVGAAAIVLPVVKQ